jgi:hypothetical protein
LALISFRLASASASALSKSLSRVTSSSWSLVSVRYSSFSITASCIVSICTAAATTSTF